MDLQGSSCLEGCEPQIVANNYTSLDVPDHVIQTQVNINSQSVVSRTNDTNNGAENKTFSQWVLSLVGFGHEQSQHPEGQDKSIQLLQKSEALKHIVDGSFPTPETCSSTTPSIIVETPACIPLAETVADNNPIKSLNDITPNSIPQDPPHTSSQSPSQGEDPPNTSSQSPSQGAVPPNTSSQSPSQGAVPPNTSSQSAPQGTDPPNTSSQSPSQGADRPNTSSQSAPQGTDPPNTSSQSALQGESCPVVRSPSVSATTAPETQPDVTSTTPSNTCDQKHLSVPVTIITDRGYRDSDATELDIDVRAPKTKKTRKQKKKKCNDRNDSVFRDLNSEETLTILRMRLSIAENKGHLPTSTATVFKRFRSRTHYTIPLHPIHHEKIKSVGVKEEKPYNRKLTQPKMQHSVIY